ncbi:putative GTP cyclohydrolase I [Toxoplasma gondii GT1]|uniref:GTP cyclohydrolase 1 n=3 Tax=Toxoplasma gondii TaxID=5811 RepID=S7UMM8_TOXGG|nr:putative GTP cyclohydrolase I [Toxoplasma gondii GT1]KFG52945.1 putative GTP cyclohydrolase I [Toxoplasma gondii FOU]RQX68630.1 putative GTP cyclohydrolase I [Toxoplasma gondii CAST]
MEKPFSDSASLSSQREAQSRRKLASYIQRARPRSPGVTRRISRGSSVDRGGGTGSISTCSSGRDLSRHVPVSNDKPTLSTHELRKHDNPQVNAHFGSERHGFLHAGGRSVPPSHSRSSSEALRRPFSQTNRSINDGHDLRTLEGTHNTGRRTSRTLYAVGCTISGSCNIENNGCATDEDPNQKLAPPDRSHVFRRAANGCSAHINPRRFRSDGVNSKEQLVATVSSPALRFRGELRTSCSDGGGTGDEQSLDATRSDRNRARRRRGRRGKLSKRRNDSTSVTPLTEWSAETQHSEGQGGTAMASYGVTPEAFRSTVCQASNAQHNRSGREFSSTLADVPAAAYVSKLPHIPRQSTDQGLGEDKKNAIEEGVRMILRAMGEDVTRAGLRETPKRVAAAMEFFSRGYRADPKDVIRNALFSVEEGHEDGQYLAGKQGMVTVGRIDISSLCEHHLLPFFGKCHIGYIPDKHVLGISKFARIMEIYSRRLQIQERLTQQIALAVMKVAKPRGVAVLLECTHMCMAMRGVSSPGSVTTTKAFLGVFETDPALRSEFMSSIFRQAAAGT